VKKTLVFILFILISINPAISAPTFSITPIGGLILTPGIDVVRKIIADIRISPDTNYEIQISDTAGGMLMNGNFGLKYRLSFNNGVDFQPTRTPVTIDSGRLTRAENKALSISINGSETATAPAGSYSSTIIITYIAP